MSVLVGTQEVLKLHNKEPGKARPANRDQSAVEGCPRSLRLHRRIAPDNARALTGLATFRVTQTGSNPDGRHASRVRSSAVRTLVRDCEDNPAATSTIVRQSRKEN